MAATKQLLFALVPLLPQVARSTCELPAQFGEDHLRELVVANCDRVSRTEQDYESAASKIDGWDDGQVGDWKTRHRHASFQCLKAKSPSMMQRAPRRAADMAVKAWGDSIMGGRECCIYLEAPWCVDQSFSTSMASVVLLFFVLLILFLISWASGQFLRQPHVEPVPWGEEPVATAKKKSPGAGFALGPGSGYLGRAAQQLQKELEEVWSRSCLRVLPGEEAFRRSSSVLFSALYEVFDFQRDSVQNQYEHLISLWRSQLAMVADRATGKGEKVEEEGLLEEALGDLRADLLDGFVQWRACFNGYSGASFKHEDDKIPSMGGARWQKVIGTAADPSAENNECSVWLAEVSTYLLCWGEAGNLRFMPEVIYFITELALKAENFDVRSIHSIEDGDSYRSSAYLTRIVRPLYTVIFDEWYDHVDVKKDKDAKKLHTNFENFLPPDVANYDDWNEYFCVPERLTEGLLLSTGALLFDLAHENRYAALCRVDWHVSLQAAEVKTHREVHSLWAVFASTHRVWLLHAALFLSGVVLITNDAPSPPDGSQILMGRDLATRFAAVGLVVPLHAFLWRVACKLVTGQAARKTHASLNQMICRSLKNLLWASPIVTYFFVRLSADHDTGSVSWKVSLVIHTAAWGIGLLLLLFVPAGVLRKDRLPRWLQPLSELFRNPTWNTWETTPVPLRERFVRYTFWALVLTVKFFLWRQVLGAVWSASLDLGLAPLGQQSILSIPKILVSTNGVAGVLLWMLLWSTAFVLYVADTQLWFTLGCTVLGALTVLVQRKCAAASYATEDAVALVPERFSAKVLPYVTAPRKGKTSLRFSPVFPAIWDRIVEFMRYEDKIDNALMGDLSFTPGQSGIEVTWDRLSQPVLRGTLEASPREAGIPDPSPASGPTSGVSTKIMVPDMFRGKTACERCFKQLFNVIDPHFPGNADAQWRILALSRGLGLPMPRPFRVPYIPGLTVLIPHYGETILMAREELYQDAENIEVPLMDWLQTKYDDEFTSFTTRMQASSISWPVAGTQWDEYTSDQWKKVTSWATMRMQTLWRTVAGMCLYYPALELHFEVQGDKQSSLTKVWRASDVFTCLVSMQMYKYFSPRMLEETNRMFAKFPDCLKVAYIDCEDKGGSAMLDLVHARQKRRYFSCLIDGACAVDSTGRRQSRFRVELPGYPILGDGKGDNQNHAIPFMRGSFAQCIDANQGAYFEQMLLLPCVLGEFRSLARGDGRAKRIVGFAEHITSDIGSIGDFAAQAEVAFGTILQRTYAVLGARMHYGHPDIMNKVFMMQQGGVSKATKTVNLSEDIFAGMDFTLRGDGRKIFHKEYFNLAKGRDLGFNTVLGFFSKLSSGTGEQILTRQVYRLGQLMHLPEALSFYYAHAGYYFTQFFVSISMPLLAFVWLLALLSDCEDTFKDVQHCSPTRKSASQVVATMLVSMFSWLLLLFLVATSLPLFTEVWMQRSFKRAFTRMLVSLGTLSPLMFIFQAKVIGSYVTNEFRYGGASYVATGRGLPTERRPFIGEAELTGLKMKKVGGLYLDYASIAFYDGALLLTGASLILYSGGVDDAGPNVSMAFFALISLSLTIISWLFAPFIFNPYQFVKRHFFKDLRALLAFFLEDGGRHWIDWYDRTQVQHRKGMQTINDIAFAVEAFFLAAWFASLNLKIEALSSVYRESDNQTSVLLLALLPPIGFSFAYCLLVVLSESTVGCSSMFYRRLEAMRELVRARRARKARAGGDDETEEAEDLETPEELVRARTQDFHVRPAPPTRMKTRPFAQRAIGLFGCSLGVPLPVSSVVVLLLDLLEIFLTLHRIYRIGWWKGVVSGLILKWGLQMAILFLLEGVLRARCFNSLGVFGLPVQLWVHSHKMMRDIVTSSLIFGVLAPWVLLNSLNDLICPSCSVHMLLIYRDPGHLKRKEADLVELAKSRTGEEADLEAPRHDLMLSRDKDVIHCAAPPSESDHDEGSDNDEVVSRAESELPAGPHATMDAVAMTAGRQGPEGVTNNSPLALSSGMARSNNVEGSSWTQRERSDNGDTSSGEESFFGI